jgi:hypothetical protein
MFLPLAAVLLLALIWTVYWFVTAGVVKNRFSEERTALAARGVSLTCAEEGWGGYPFHFEFTCSSPLLDLGSRADIKSSRLLLAALAYAPWQFVVLLDGPSTLASGDHPPMAVTHQRAIAALTFDRDWHLAVSAEIPKISAGGYFSAGQLMLHARPSATGGLDVAVSTSDATLFEESDQPLSIEEGELLAVLTSDRTLAIKNVSLRQAGVRYRGSGTVGLDSSNRLTGKLDTETNDLDGLLSILEPHLQVAPEQKSGLRTMLGLLGNGTRIPLTAKEGVLYLGPFKIAQLLPIY